MHVYRISNPLYIEDLSGAGARLRGGLWNEVGTPVIYTACTLALAAWEVRVHLSNNILPRHDAFSFAVISIPENSILDATDLRPDWQQDEKYTRSLGQAWVNAQAFLCMKVPSAVIKDECNFLINPAHHLAGQVIIEETAPFRFDPRTFLSF